MTTAEQPSRPAYVYEITNAKDGTVYVGKAVDPESRWEAHVNAASQPLVIAMVRDGIDGFTFRALKQCADEREALKEEATCIRQHVSAGDAVYNIVGGPSSRVRRVPLRTEPKPEQRETPSGRWNGRIYWGESNRMWSGKVFDSGSHKWVSKQVPLSAGTDEGAAMGWFGGWFEERYP
jgi:predicted GIY-YIG superfamily endonuclease